MENEMNSPTEQASAYNIPTQETTMTPTVSLSAYLDTLRSEQNLTMAIVFGLAASLLGAVLWAVITVATGYQIGYMAIAIGFMAGFAVRKGGKGVDKVFGITGAVFALLGCLLGNVLSIIGYVANSENLGYFQTLSMVDYSLIPSVMAESFSALDILLYGIAIYEGYKFSFRQITEEEALANNVVA
jgi:hypothetical protein